MTGRICREKRSYMKITPPFFIFVLIATSAPADVLILKDGKRIEG